MACQLAWARVPAGLMALRCIAACWKPGVAAVSPPALRLLLTSMHPQACALWMPETFLSYREVPGVGRQEFVAGLEKVKHDRWAGLWLQNAYRCTRLHLPPACKESEACPARSPSWNRACCSPGDSCEQSGFCSRPPLSRHADVMQVVTAVQAGGTLRHLRPHRRSSDGVPAARRLPHQLPRAVRPQHRPLP